jgi:hypothetical protein
VPTPEAASDAAPRPDHAPDLLQPSLAPDLDANRFQRPWDPTSLPYTGFWGGPIAGGILTAINWRRLGSPGRARSVLLWTALVAFALPLHVTLRRLDLTDGTPLDHRQAGRLLSVIVGVGFTFLVSRKQRALVEAWEAEQHKPASLWRPGFLAILLGRALELVLIGVCFVIAHLLFDMPLRGR